MTSLILCQFDESQTLSRKECDLSNTKYIAISHVWMEASWNEIPKIPFPVLASPQKALWIANELPALVGDSLFWMDILAVDQSSDEERFKVASNIPIVYRNASKTIIVREDHGFRDCCSGILDKQGSDVTIVQQKLDHMRRFHPMGVNESWIGRLWPLQEANLSRVIQFTVCKRVDEATPVGPPRSYLWELESKTRAGFALQIDEINHAASIWANRGQYIWTRNEAESIEEFNTRSEREMGLLREGKDKFISAIYSNGTVTREEFVSEDENQSLKSLFGFLDDSTKSPRETGKARDFVLALFPSYQWYKPPQDVRKMDFVSIWSDSIEQLSKHHIDNGLHQYIVKPRLTMGVLNHFKVPLEANEEPATDIPMPKTLGQFCKLYNLRNIKPDGRYGEPRGKFEFTRLDAAEMSMVEIIDLVSTTLFRAKSARSSEWRVEWQNWKQKWKAEVGDGEFFGRENGNIAWRSYEEDGRAMDKDITWSDFIEWTFLHESKDRDEAGEILDAIWSIHRYRPQIGDDVTGFPRNGRPILADGSKLRLYNDWGKITLRAGLADRPFLRNRLLRLAALQACGLGLNALEWSEGKLDPYLLKFTTREFTDGNVEEPQSFEFLALAAPDLVLDNSDRITALGHSAPWVSVRSDRDDGKLRVIGLAPEIVYDDPDEKEDDITFRMGGSLFRVSKFTGLPPKFLENKHLEHVGKFREARIPLTIKDLDDITFTIGREMASSYEESGFHCDALDWYGFELKERTKLYGEKEETVVETLDVLEAKLDLYLKTYEQNLLFFMDGKTGDDRKQAELQERLDLDDQGKVQLEQLGDRIQNLAATIHEYGRKLKAQEITARSTIIASLAFEKSHVLIDQGVKMIFIFAKLSSPDGVMPNEQTVVLPGGQRFTVQKPAD